jgi:hypothetical protein
MKITGSAHGTVVVKGGPGSGFSGHAGRPGQVGGSAADAAGRPRVLPDSMYAKLPVGTNFYHVSPAANAKEIESGGLLSSSKVARNSSAGLVDWKVDHPVDGVFLASWGQAKAIVDQFAQEGAESTIFEVYIPKGTTVFQDPIMLESSLMVEGDIPARRIRSLPKGYKPPKNNAQTVLDNMKWKKYIEKKESTVTLPRMTAVLKSNTQV